MYRHARGCIATPCMDLSVVYMGMVYVGEIS